MNASAVSFWKATNVQKKFSKHNSITSELETVQEELEQARQVFLGRQIIFYYMDGTETSSCLLQITQLICFTFNKSAESDRPHDKVFHGSKFMEIHNHYMAGFPAPADLCISDETSLLLFPASPPPQ